MRKTSEEVEADIYAALKNSSIKDLISGKIYLNGTRPLDARTEDGVITFLSGIDIQVQTGIVNVNIYVPNINNGQSKGLKIKDVKRCKEISMALQSFQLSIRILGEYYIELDSMIKTFEADEIEEYFVNCRLKFKRITF